MKEKPAKDTKKTKVFKPSKKAKKGKGDWLVTPMSKWKKRHVEAEYGIKVDYV